MNATNIQDFRDAVGEFVDSVAAFSKAMACRGEIAGMEAENAHRQSCGLSIAYGDEAFIEVLERYGLRTAPATEQVKS